MDICHQGGLGQVKFIKALVKANPPRVQHGSHGAVADQRSTRIKQRLNGMGKWAHGFSLSVQMAVFVFYLCKSYRLTLVAGQLIHAGAANVKVLRLWMVNDDGGCGLFWHQLEGSSQRHTQFTLNRQ